MEYNYLDRGILDKLGKLVRYENEQAYINEEDISYLYTDIGLFCQILEVFDRNNIKIKRKKITTAYLKQMVYNYQKTKDLKIRDQIIEVCMRYIYAYVIYCCKYYGINQDELISYGYEGLEYAISNYDGTIPIEQYIYKYIEYYILMGIRRSSIIVSDFGNIIYSNFIKEIKLVEQKYNVSVEEDSQLIEEIFENIKKKYSLNEKQIKMLKTKYLIANPIYMENIMYDEKVDNIDPEKIAIIDEMLFSLKERDRELIRMKYRDKCTLPEIGIKQGVSKQNVSIREQRILKKMNEYLLNNRKKEK